MNFAPLNGVSLDGAAGGGPLWGTFDGVPLGDDTDWLGVNPLETADAAGGTFAAGLDGVPPGDDTDWLGVNPLETADVT